MADDRLVQAAAKIADGTGVDWPELRSTLSIELAEGLAVIDRIVGAHRELHALLPDASTVESGAHWGHIELFEEVGRGSFGIVYRGLDTRLNREVALKLYRESSQSLALIEEGQRLARITHPNVVTVFGADVIDGRPGIWMEYVRGQRLDSVIKEQGPLSAKEATVIGEELARALAAVHAADLVHRDVKAPNVMREAGGRILLMDLGVSDSSAPIQQPVRLAGTPLYMAPEVLEGAQPTPATDLYSLGVLLFYLVSGVFPVEGRTFEEMRQQHMLGRRRSLTDLRPGIPAGFTRVVSRAIEADPARRFHSAGEFSDALAALVEPRRRVGRAWLLGIGAAIAAVVLSASLFWRPANQSDTTTGRSLAVLPIRNLTGVESNGYLADGFTEVITSTLARLPGLRVPSSFATQPYRNSPDAPEAIGRKLGVQLLLAGSVTQADERIRLNVQLIEASTGRLVWGQEIVRSRATVLTAQSEIAETVAAQLSLPSADQKRGSPVQAQTAAAQDEYLRGLVDVNSQIDTRYESGTEHFRRAVALEPAFAAAWAELALAELRGIEGGDWQSRTTRAQQAREDALRAIRFDPAQPAGYVALASVQYYHDWDFASADATFQRALAIAPSHAFARMRYAYLLASRGDVKGAIREAMDARDLEPLVPVRSTALGIFRYYDRDYSGALADMQRALALSPGFVAGHYGSARVLLAMGRTDDAIASYRHALGSDEPNPAFVAGLAYAYGVAGRHADVTAALAQLTDLERAGRRASIDHHAYIAITQGRMDDAFALLNEAMDRRMTNVLWLPVDPRVDPIRKDVRFPALLARLNVRSPH